LIERKIEALKDMATKVRELFLIAVMLMIKSNCCGSLFFFIEHAGELRIFILREEKSPNIHPKDTKRTRPILDSF